MVFFVYVFLRLTPLNTPPTFGSDTYRVFRVGSDRRPDGHTRRTCMSYTLHIRSQSRARPDSSLVASTFALIAPFLDDFLDWNFGWVLPLLAKLTDDHEDAQEFVAHAQSAWRSSTGSLWRSHARRWRCPLVELVSHTSPFLYIQVLNRISGTFE